MKHFLIVAIFGLNILPSNCQEYSKNQVIEDLEFLVQSIEKFNPLLYEYNPDFKQQAQHIITSIYESVSSINYFKYVNNIAALSNEGHLKVTSTKQYPFLGILQL
ncbi:hypothetical protein [uncultured Polaribacter sp.]|uniref:hypothetical protein n=1 Tax=uncultured Polaribacter sp. TaxID=174711 RepID=UPI002633418B|nr:hypothetical protein [uncultured Polaribacter sp.]